MKLRTTLSEGPAVAALLLICLSLGACDPLIEIGGAYFPCWLFCPLAGAACAFALHLALAALKLERSLWRPGVFYAGVAVLSGCAAYLAFFR